MNTVAVLSYTPAPGAARRAVGVAVFRESGPTLLRMLGESGEGELDWVPFASLFPQHAGLAWAYAEWVHWLRSCVLDEGIPLAELRNRLGAPTMGALQVASAKELPGKSNVLLQRVFDETVSPQDTLPVGALAPLFEEMVTELVARLAQERNALLVLSTGDAGWDMAVTGRSRGLITVKAARQGVSPEHRAAAIRRTLPGGREETARLVVTNLPAVAERLRAGGTDALALGEPGYRERLTGWLTDLC